MSAENRLGRFFIKREMLRNNLDALLHVMRDMVVFQTTYRMDTDEVEYLAWCEEFDEIPEARVAPTYQIEIDIEHEVTEEVLNDGTIQRRAGKSTVTRNVIRSNNASAIPAVRNDTINRPANYSSW